MQFPPFPTYIMGLLTDTGKNVPWETAGRFPCAIPRTPVCAGAPAGADVPRGPGVGRKTVALFLLFCTLFPGIGAGARPGSDQVMSCGLSLSVCTFPCRSCLGIREGTVQGLTSGCASSLRAAPFRAGPFGAAHSGLPHFEMPQQPENALHLCCHSSALVPCALRGSSAGSARCFTPGSRRFLLCPAFQERSIIVGLMGGSRAVSPI